MTASLHVVTYHYVRDLPRTEFPAIKGLLLSSFHEQIEKLAASYEMASLESCLAFLRGEYVPTRDLCLLTFDDGLKEHFAEVTPALEERGIQGVFFVITSCIEEGVVAPVHMNHFLTARLGFDAYRSRFLESLDGTYPVPEVSEEVAVKTYPWDTADVAQFKYLFNFALPAEVRDRVVQSLFRIQLGSESKFARSLYVSWDEVADMQRSGMVIGGHTHRHRPLSAMTEEEMRLDLDTSKRLLDAHVKPNGPFPFSYPYGKRESFTEASQEHLRELGFDCAFTTVEGSNSPGAELFSLRRVDTKKAPAVPEGQTLMEVRN
jgi:peptidoglycan/xylan/chitin deacetylase (PgdA/CDA1 family)